MRIAVVTGASSGMGQEFARAVDREETLDEIWLIARRTERLEALASELRNPTRVLALDLGQMSALESYSALLEQLQPQISTLVNAAGFGIFGLTTDISPENLLAMVDLNCKALLSLTLSTLPHMARGSRVINVDSLSSFHPVPYINVYAATKAFVLSFSRALGVELQPRGIRVMAVCPGWVKTEFFDRAVTGDGAVTYFNKYWTPQQVVERAMKDYRRGREVSILGFSVRAQVLLTKLLPHRLVMKIWMKQQGHSSRPNID